MPTPLRIVLVGCGKMGQIQAKILASLPEFKLTGACDINTDSTNAAATATGAKPYADFDAMLAEQRPDAVAICTANDTHAAYTIAAAKFPGVRGVFCEKPMATNMADARAMVAACREKKIPLAINHMRRIRECLKEMRRLMQSGAIGPVTLFRGQCAGDILSDGSHLIDSVLFFAGDEPVEWVFGQIHRIVDPAKPRDRWRYGHVVESGGVGVFQFKSGLRAEILCGDMREASTQYHDLSLFGATGRLWHKSDFWPNVEIQDTASGGWRVVPLPQPDPNDWGIHDAYRMFADAIHNGTVHPMNGDIALRGFEVLMAVYESARLHRKIKLPLEQDRFPLELMIEAHQL